MQAYAQSLSLLSTSGPCKPFMDICAWLRYERPLCRWVRSLLWLAAERDSAYCVSCDVVTLLVFNIDQVE
jgi:hypothetical protein